MMKMNIIGAGKMGTLMGLLFSRHPNIEIQSIYSRSVTSANTCARKIGEGKVVEHLSELGDAKLTLITTSDSAISELVKSLSTQPYHWDHQFVFHCSGSLLSNVLQPLADKGAKIASLHPMLSVSVPEESLKKFPGTLCTCEGDAEWCEALSTFFTGFGARVATIKPDQKTLYHAACCMAANYNVTLMAASELALLEAGLDQASAHQGLLHLQESVLQNLSSTSNFIEALTGPVARGDEAVCQRHVQALSPLGYVSVYDSLKQLTQSLIKIKPR